METHGPENRLLDQECYVHGSRTNDSNSHLAIPRVSSIEIPVTHFEQRYNWDCGIACIFMALNDERRNLFFTNFENICKDEGFGNCVWTIDLAYLLRRFDVPHVYCTITCGVDPGYKKEAFYTKVMSMDEMRVNRRFQNASSNYVNVSLRTVHLTDIINHLSDGKLIIVLVNSNLLRCNRCFSSMYPTSTWFTCFKCNIPYHGHFILLCGFRHAEKQILYRNPSLKDRICTISYSAFEQARKSYGTDEDIIFINPNRELLGNIHSFR